MTEYKWKSLKSHLDFIWDLKWPEVERGINVWSQMFKFWSWASFVENSPGFITKMTVTLFNQLSTQRNTFMFRPLKVSWKQICVGWKVLEGVWSHDDGEAEQRAGSITEGRVLCHHLQVQDVLSGTNQRTRHHQHAAHITGSLQWKQPINDQRQQSDKGLLFHTDRWDEIT